MRRVLAIVALAAGAAHAQDVRPPEATDLFVRIRQRALDELATIPNYVCTASIERYQGVPGIRPFHELDRVHLELAHIEGTDRFSWLGDSAFQAQTPSAILGYGASIGGDFANNRALVFLNQSVRIGYAGREMIEGKPAVRYQYEVPPTSGGLAMTIGNVSAVAGARGSFWADSDSAEVLRIDMEAYDIPRSLQVRSMSDRTMYWRVLIGERPVLLARNSEFVLTQLDGVVLRNVSALSGCREFTAQSTVSFGATPTPAAAAAPKSDGVRLPAGLELELALDTPVDPDKAAVGDYVRAHILARTGDIPKGARVYGRVNRMMRFDQGRGQRRKPRSKHSQPGAVQYEHVNELLIGLEFTEIEYRRTRMAFAARLIDVEAGQVRSFGYFGDNNVVRYDPPGTASLYVADHDAVLRRGFTTRWLTVTSQSGS